MLGEVVIEIGHDGLALALFPLCHRILIDLFKHELPQVVHVFGGFGVHADVAGVQAVGDHPVHQG